MALDSLDFARSYELLAFSTQSAARLFVIPARDEPVAVVFRRGPSRWTLMLKWDLKTDTVIPGQWIKGRIYERRCDLSPSGERLVYFVGKFNHPWGSWTAIYRPPDFTTKTLWRNGTAWGGGGVFENETSLLINQRQTTPSNGFDLPYSLGVNCYRGEQLLYQLHLANRGWKQIGEGEYKPGISLIYEKASHSLCLRMQAMLDDGLSNEYAICRIDGEPLFSLDDASWADWDRNGDLLLARRECLHRLVATKLRDYPDKGDAVLKCVADLNDFKPDPQPSIPPVRRGRFR